MELIFNSSQAKKINTFLWNYDQNEEFRKEKESNYDIEPYKLSILEIYALEEIKRYGDKNIYSSYLALRDDNTDLEDHLGFYEYFRNRITTNLEFAIKKYSDIHHLSQNEAFIINMILQSVAKRENIELYDPFNPILTSNEEETIKTIKNHTIGIIALLISDRHPNMFKQRERGQFSKESKKELIEILKNWPGLQERIDKEIDEVFLQPGPSIKLVCINWNNNTNISYDEVFEDSKKPKSKK